jgi:hypothetical protein
MNMNADQNSPSEAPAGRRLRCICVFCGAAEGKDSAYAKRRGSSVACWHGKEWRWFSAADAWA